MSGPHRQCPGCQAPVTLWQVMRAPLPSRLRCSGCRARLGFDINLLAITGLAVLALAALIWLIQPVYAWLAVFGIAPAALLAAAGGLGLWLLFEAGLAWFLLNQRRLHVSDG